VQEDLKVFQDLQTLQEILLLVAVVVQVAPVAQEEMLSVVLELLHLAVILEFLLHMDNLDLVQEDGLLMVGLVEDLEEGQD
jgi:hypothetical protein